MEVDEAFVDVVDEVVNDLLDEAEKHASACLLQAGIRGTLERKRLKLERERMEILQRAWRCRLAKKYLQGLRENAAAVHIQRHVRARLARNEVTALKLQRVAIDEVCFVTLFFSSSSFSTNGDFGAGGDDFNTEEANISVRREQNHS